MTRKPALLMCSPKYFDVDYVINPWMNGNLHKASKPLAEQQWQTLYRELSNHAHVKLVEPHEGLPDMVFTANAGLVRNGEVLISRFKCAERQGEEQLFADWFAEAGKRVARTTVETPFEGEGDALFSADGTRLWGGYGFRTSKEVYEQVGEWTGKDVQPLRLVDPRFYHLDTCFAPLPNGDVMYFPPAFDAEAIRAIEAFYPAERRIIVGEEDALLFACNVVCLERTLVLNKASARLRARLEARGFQVVEVTLSEFLKAGGAAKCLVLHLD